jgi:hypothetical protein
MACASWPEPRGPAATGCWPGFPYQDGWLGGDAAYSIPLSDTHTLWLFGDTFIGEPGKRDRRDAHFVHNSIGVSTCRAGEPWAIEYAWGRGPDGAPRAFLSPSDGAGWWWLFDGFVHDHALYLGVVALEPAEPRGPLGLPFRFDGVRLARIEGSHRNVRDWEVEILPLTANRPDWGSSAMAVHAGHVYLFVFSDDESGRFPRQLARLPLRALEARAEEIAGSLEYLAEDGQWSPGLDLDRARVVMDDNATEMSVRYHAATDRWLALYNYPDVGAEFPAARPSDAVWLRTASLLEGPWSERKLLFRIPELDPDYVGGYDPNTACYAAKEHAQLSSSDKLTFTYVCNLFAGPGQDPYAILGRLATTMRLYRPVPVSVSMPADLGP